MQKNEMMNLIRKAKDRDPDAFTTLMQQQTKDMYRVAIAILMNDEDANLEYVASIGVADWKDSLLGKTIVCKRRGYVQGRYQSGAAALRCDLKGWQEDFFPRRCRRNGIQ